MKKRCVRTFLCLIITAILSMQPVMALEIQFKGKEPVQHQKSPLSIEFYNSITSPSTKILLLNFKVKNIQDEAINLSDINIRYYFTNEGNKSLKFRCLWSNKGRRNIKGRFEDMSLSKEDTCLEIGFKKNAGKLLSGEEVEIIVVVNKKDWSDFDQTNDYSFNASSSEYTQTKKVLGYYKDKGCWGYDQIRTLSSFHAVESCKLYTMNCYGDFGFEDYLKVGSENDAETVAWIGTSIYGLPYANVEKAEYGCTAFAAKNSSGQAIYGKNYDWWEDNPVLLLFCDPPNGYSSVNVCDLKLLGIADDNISKTHSELLMASYVFMEGMNEKGVCISLLMVDDAQPPEDPDKTTLYTQAIMRLVLDYAQDLDEAMDLIKKYNLYFFGDTKSHFLISDAKGNSAVLEYVNGEIVFTKPSKPWQVITNDTMVELSGDSWRWRRSTANEILEAKDGVMVNEKMEGMQLLETVSIPYHTSWSTIYNQQTGDIYIAVSREFANVKKFKLEMSN